jgi:hypothetical protein
MPYSVSGILSSPYRSDSVSDFMCRNDSCPNIHTESGYSRAKPPGAKVSPRSVVSMRGASRFSTMLKPLDVEPGQKDNAVIVRFFILPNWSAMVVPAASVGATLVSYNQLILKASWQGGAP